MIPVQEVYGMNSTRGFLLNAYSFFAQQQSGIAVSCADGLRFESNLMPWLNPCSLLTQQWMGTRWQHWGDKSGEKWNWPPYVICQWFSISVLSNRLSLTYKSIRYYLYFNKFWVNLWYLLMILLWFQEKYMKTAILPLGVKMLVRNQGWSPQKNGTMFF